MPNVPTTTDTLQDELVGPLYPPSPVGIERAWHMLMRQKGTVEVGYAHGVKVQRRSLRAFMARR